MQKVKMLRTPRGKYENEPFPAVGEEAEFSDDVASTLVRFKYAAPVDSDEDVDGVSASEAQAAAELQAEREADAAREEAARKHAAVAEDKTPEDQKPDTAQARQKATQSAPEKRG